MTETSIVLVAAVVGAVEFLRRLQLHDYFAAITIAVSALIGVLCGVFHAPGVVDGWAGLVMGLGASGLVTVASKVNTSVTPVVTKS